MALDQKESISIVASYRDQSDLELTMLLNIHGQVGRNYAVQGLPTLHFIDRNGVIHFKRAGLMEQAEVEAQVEALPK